jgi:pyruvyltransferase
VRGPNTEAVVRKIVSSISQLPHGDPAFLLPYLYREYLIKGASEKGFESNSRFCYIPNEADDEQLVSGQLPSDVSLVSTKLPSEQALESLQQCDFVASSSLNGIILADALGMHTKWLQTSKGDEHAFELADYFSSTQRMVGNIKCDFDKIMDQNGYIEPLSLDERESFADRMAASFPFDLFETLLNKMTLAK